MMIMRLIPPIAVILPALCLIFLARRSAIETAGALSYFDIVAQIVLWLGAAWLARRAIAVALDLYLARKLRVEGSPRFLDSGRHLLTDLIGLIVFVVAVLG